MLHTRKGRDNPPLLLLLAKTARTRGHQALLVTAYPAGMIIVSPFSCIMPTYINATLCSSIMSSRSGTGSNDPIPIQTVVLAPFTEDSTASVEIAPIQVMLPQSSPRKKAAVKKKLTPKKLQLAAASPATQVSPASPASNTRSKKKLHLQ